MCKAVLGSLSTYYFALYKAPKKVLHTLENIRRRFFGGGEDRSRKISWVAWERILCERKKGGLGVGSLRALNIAMLGKWWWRERNETYSMWKSVVSLYNSAQSSNVSKSWIWGRIKNIDMDLSALGIDLQNYLQRKENGSGWLWTLDPSNSYTVRSLRLLIDNSLLPSFDSETDWIRWVPSKANIHLWRVLCGRLATKDNLVKRGVEMQSLDCQMCHARDETLDHVMVSCSTTRLVMAYLARWIDWWPVSETSVQSLWGAICNGDGNGDNRDKVVRKVIGVAFLWTLWRLRNSKVFNQIIIKEEEIYMNIQFLAFEWIRGRCKLGKLLCWEKWICNLLHAVSLVSL